MSDDFYYGFLRRPSTGKLVMRALGRILGCAAILVLFLGVIAAIVWVVATVWRLA